MSERRRLGLMSGPSLRRVLEGDTKVLVNEPCRGPPSRLSSSRADGRSKRQVRESRSSFYWELAQAIY